MNSQPTGTSDQPDPYTDAMLAGAEVEQGSTDATNVVHHPRTEPANFPRHRETDRSLLTTDDEAQLDDSVIEPGNS